MIASYLMKVLKIEKPCVMPSSSRRIVLLCMYASVSNGAPKQTQRNSKDILLFSAKLMMGKTNQIQEVRMYALRSGRILIGNWTMLFSCAICKLIRSTLRRNRSKFHDDECEQALSCVIPERNAPPQLRSARTCHILLYMASWPDWPDREERNEDAANRQNLHE